MHTRLLVALALVVSMALAACGGGSGGGGGGGGSSPGDTAKNFVLATAKGDSEAVKKFIHPEKVDSTGAKMILTMMVPLMGEMVKQEGGIDRVEVVKTEKKGDDRAVVTLKIKTKKGSEETEDFDLERFKGKWYIDVNTNGGERDQPQTREPRDDELEQDDGQ